MNSNRFAAIKIIGCAVAVNFVLALIVHFFILPLLTPAGAEIGRNTLGRLHWNYTALFFVAGSVGSSLLALAVRRFARGEAAPQEMMDAVQHPVMLLDENNRHLMINKAAEITLGISRERDIGRPLDAELLSSRALFKPNETALDLRNVVRRRGSSYQVIDCPLAGRVGTSRRLLLLHNVDGQMRVRDTITELNQVMDTLKEQVNAIAGSATSLTTGATRQANSIAAISASLNDFSKKIQGNTETAAKGTQLAAQAREAAERSGKEIAHALTAMTDVQDAGIRIARIVKLIDDIAFQTNLLALNAAVEAARAGRQGKGFAVVAEEVRNLAGRSARAAKDTASMVEDVTERIGNASAYISKLENMLQNIVQDAIRMADSSTAASETSSEQAKTILEVNHELGQMSGFTNSTMSDAERTNAAVDEFSRQVSTLQEKLASITNEFITGLEAAVRERRYDFPTTTIDLEDDYAPESPFPATDLSKYSSSSSRESDSYEDFEAPFKRMAAAEDWDLSDATDGDQDYSLDSLMGNDIPASSTAEKPFGGFSKPSSTRDFKERLAKGPTEYKTNADGDRMVKPGQNIQLDDSEFGRY